MLQKSFWGVVLFFNPIKLCSQLWSQTRRNICFYSKAEIIKWKVLQAAKRGSFINLDDATMTSCNSTSSESYAFCQGHRIQRSWTQLVLVPGLARTTGELHRLPSESHVTYGDAYGTGIKILNASCFMWWRCPPYQCIWNKDGPKDRAQSCTGSYMSCINSRLSSAAYDRVTSQRQTAPYSQRSLS
jgi:hypothetical protein